MPNPIEDNLVTLHRVLSNGREYHYLIGYQGVQVLAADPSTGALRHSSELQGLWYGYDHIQQATPGGRYFWADTDGDGITKSKSLTPHLSVPSQIRFWLGSGQWGYLGRGWYHEMNRQDTLGGLRL